MSGPAYDLHLHSCLSPCGDNEMTPNNLVNMALLNGLELIALTDHNSCGNVRAAAQVARRVGLAFLPGMELCTSEEIHVICLFPDCDRAEDFSRHVHTALPPIQNRPKIFGEQLLLDEEDRPTGTEELLLINATTLSLEEIPTLVSRWDGVAFPAHIDKEANSLLSILGAFPETPPFDWFEVANLDRFSKRGDAPAISTGRRMLQNSDAHYLWDIHEGTFLLPAGDTPLHRLAETALSHR